MTLQEAVQAVMASPEFARAIYAGWRRFLDREATTRLEAIQAAKEPMKVIVPDYGRKW